jgi:hypothetical protein
MYILAPDASHVTAHQAGTYLLRGFKAIPLAIYHLLADHNAASLLQLCYLAGVLLFCVLVSALLFRLR